MVKKKILIFSLAYAPWWGGAEIAIKEITDRIGEEFSFDMITPRFDRRLPTEERVGAIQVYRIGLAKKNPTDVDLVKFPLYLAKIFYAPLALCKAVSLYRKNTYDAFWVMMAYAGFPAVFFQKLYKQIPYVLTLQEGDSIAHMTRRWRIRPVYPLLRSVFTRARAVSAISTYLGEYARSMGFARKVRIIRNGVSITDFSRPVSSEGRALFRKNMGIEKDDICLITTSRLVPKNAVGDIISSLTYLPERVKLLVIGSGPDETALRSLVEKHSLGRRVFFMGHIAYKELPRYYHAADIFVRPSLSEGMGSSFIEAMAAGLPVIGTAVGGMTDFRVDKDTGFVCEVGNPASIASQVTYSMAEENKDAVARVVRVARERIMKEYDWDTIAEKMKVLFQEIS